jgi:hypothetical protein
MHSVEAKQLTPQLPHATSLRWKLWQTVMLLAGLLVEML